MAIQVKSLLERRLLDEDEIFKFLGLDINASNNDISNMINKLNFIFHPDKNGGKFEDLKKKINFVDKVLTNYKETYISELKNNHVVNKQKQITDFIKNVCIPHIKDMIVQEMKNERIKKKYKK